MSISSKIDKITTVTEDRRHPILTAPRSVKIELTGRCNFKCSFCARSSKLREQKEMAWPLFVRLLMEMHAAGVKEIGLFYLGESFMAPALLVEAIHWCKKALHVPYVFLTTNGSLATPERVKACMEAGLDSLKFSINAADKAQFEKVMGVTSKMFDRAISNLQSARAIRDAGQYECGIYASAIQYDGEQKQKMDDLLNTEILPYVDQFYLLPLYGQMTHWNTDREASLGYKPTAGNQGRIGALRDPLPCWSAFTEGHVTADGILTACCFDSDGRFAMGDLREQDFMAAWHSRAFMDLRAAHLKKNVDGTICEGCIAYA